MESVELGLQDLEDFNKFLRSPGVKVLERFDKGDCEVVVCNTNQRFIVPKLAKQSNEQLIFGKDKTQAVVSVEVMGNNLVVYKQLSDGTIEKEIREHKYWFLTSRAATKNAKKLEGNLHYKWINYTDSEEEYDSMNLYKLDAHKIYDKKEKVQ
jgi:hypothetical protein